MERLERLLPPIGADCRDDEELILSEIARKRIPALRKIVIPDVSVRNPEFWVIEGRSLCAEALRSMGLLP